MSAHRPIAMQIGRARKPSRSTTFRSSRSGRGSQDPSMGSIILSGSYSSASGSASSKPRVIPSSAMTTIFPHLGGRRELARTPPAQRCCSRPRQARKIASLQSCPRGLNQTAQAVELLWRRRGHSFHLFPGRGYSARRDVRRVCADQHEHIGHSKKEKVSHQGRCGPATRHLSSGTEPPPLSPPSLALLTPQREGPGPVATGEWLPPTQECAVYYR